VKNALPAGLVMLALVAVAIAPETAIGAGRRPYGAAIEVPVRDFSGLADPHVVESRSGRLVASLVHGHLFRAVDGAFVPDLAVGPGAWAGDALTVTLADTARFHDGRAVEAADVVASWRRLAALGDQSPIGKLAQAIQVSDLGPRVVVFTARGGVAEEVRALLARPEAAILARGQPGVGCGPFKPEVVGGGEGERRVLVAWEGHALGRPWLQEVRLRRVSAEREEAAFRFGEVELAFEPPRITPTGATTVRGGWTSWLVVFHPRFRGSAGAAFRGWVHAASLDARLGRYVDGRSLPGDVPWPPQGWRSLDSGPEPLAPIEPKSLGARAAVGRDQLVVAFTEGETDSEELARALRDVVRPAARVDARAQPVRGLDLALAKSASDPTWDIAIVRWEWASLTRAQAAHELARALGINGPPAADVIGRRVSDWARGVVHRTDALAIVHAERPAILHAKIRGVVPSGPLPDLVQGWSGAR